MMSCKDVAWAIGSEELAEAGWRRRLAVRFHLVLCRACRCYAGQMGQLGEEARCLEQPEPDKACLDRLERQLSEEIEAQTLTKR